MKPLLIWSAIGAASSAVGWLTPPSRVTSEAWLTAPGLEAPQRAEELQQRVAALSLRSRPFLTAPIHAFGLYEGSPMDDAFDTMRRDLAFEPVRLGPAQALRIRFRYQGPRKAAAVVSMMSHHLRREGFHILDPASYPIDRTKAYRLAARELGLPLDVVTGLILAWRRKRRTTTRAEILPAT